MVSMNDPDYVIGRKNMENHLRRMNLSIFHPLRFSAWIKVDPFENKIEDKFRFANRQMAEDAKQFLLSIGADIRFGPIEENQYGIASAIVQVPSTWFNKEPPLQRDLH